MAQEFKYMAIVLGKRDIGETDRLYILYTREKGKIAVVGKGTKKSDAKLAGNLETGMLSEVFVAQGRGKGKIIGAIPLDYFWEIKNSQELLFQMLRVFKIFGKIVSEQEKDERMFDLLLGYLKTLEKNPVEERGPNGTLRPEKNRMITLGFMFKFIDFLGYGIEVEKCVNCGVRLLPESNYFMASRGGVVCGKCASNLSGKIKISPETIKTIRLFLRNRIENFGKISVPEEKMKNLEMIQKLALDWIMD